MNDNIKQYLTEGWKLKPMNLAKVKNLDKLMNTSLKDAKLYTGSSYERATNVGDLVFFLNMVAGAWENKGNKFPKAGD